MAPFLTQSCGSLSTQTLNRSVFGWTETVPPPLNKTIHFPPTATMARVDQAAMRVLLPMFKMGIFDRPIMSLNATANNVTSAEHNAVARKLAREAMVLLQNSGSLLPLDGHKLRSIALIGKDAASPTVGGGGSGGSFPYAHTQPSSLVGDRSETDTLLVITITVTTSRHRSQAFGAGLLGSCRHRRHPRAARGSCCTRQTWRTETM